MHKLAIITTHPIQYNAPAFQHLSASGIQCRVFYTWGKSVLQNKYDPDFGKTIEWDIPLLEGYEYEFCENISKKPGSHDYYGIINPHLIHSIIQYKATHVLVIGWRFKSHLQVLKYFKGKIPVLFRGDSTLLDQSSGVSIKTFARKLYLSRVYKKIDFALYVGTANKAYYKNMGLAETQLVFAPHAIDNFRFSKINTGQLQWVNETKSQANVKEDDVSIVFCGKLHEKKNPLLLLKAVNNLLQKNVHLFFIGDGELERQLKNEATGKKNIHFLPFQNQSMMPAVYRLGDIFCLPSQGPGETWGLAVNEAMACGKAVLVSDKAGSTVDLVREGVNGYSFKSNDSKDLQGKLELMIKDKEKLNQMGKVSLELIKPWNFGAIAVAINKAILSA